MLIVDSDTAVPIYKISEEGQCSNDGLYQGVHLGITPSEVKADQVGDLEWWGRLVEL